MKNDDEKDLGIVIGQLRYMTNDIHELKSDMKSLLAWRWKLYGANALISVVCAGVFELMIAFLERH